MLLIISDASVLIDVICGELTSAMFSLPYKFAVPDALFIQELAERHSNLLEFGLEKKTLSGELVREASNLQQSSSKTTINDLFALVLAKQEGCLLLTGDKALKSVAEKYNVEVHGTLWLVKQMLHYEKITFEVARVGFQRMKESGSRLPWTEVEKILNKK